MAIYTPSWGGLTTVLSDAPIRSNILGNETDRHNTSKSSGSSVRVIYIHRVAANAAMYH
jgi:hypothetical protein